MLPCDEVGGHEDDEQQDATSEPLARPLEEQRADLELHQIVRTLTASSIEIYPEVNGNQKRQRERGTDEPLTELIHTSSSTPTAPDIALPTSDVPKVAP